MQGAWKAPRFLKETGYKCPENPVDGLMQYAFQRKLGTFALLASQPEILHDFNTFMGNTMGARTYWFDWYPVQERILEGVSPDSNAPLIVDVGGGKGHDLQEFNVRYPGHNLVLQDLQPVIDDALDLDILIKPVVYDMFTEQPIKGMLFSSHIRI